MMRKANELSGLLGSLRMFVDYRALNKVTFRNNYSILLVAD